MFSTNGASSQAAGVNYKNRCGEMVTHRASTPGGFFDTSLRMCLRQLGFLGPHVVDVIEKLQSAKGQGKAKNRGKGRGGKGGKPGRGPWQ